MTIIAERLVRELKKLPAPELREVWESVGLPASNSPAFRQDQTTALETVRSLYGRFAGPDMLPHLLQERARDWMSEESKLRRHSQNG